MKFLVIEMFSSFFLEFEWFHSGSRIWKEDMHSVTECSDEWFSNIFINKQINHVLGLVMKRFRRLSSN